MVPIVRCSFKLCTPKVSQKYGHTSSPSWKRGIYFPATAFELWRFPCRDTTPEDLRNFYPFSTCYQLVLQTSAVNFCCKLLLISSAIVFWPKLLLLTSAIIFCHYLLLLYLHLQLRNLYQCCCMDSAMAIQKS